MREGASDRGEDALMPVGRVRDTSWNCREMGVCLRWKPVKENEEEG